MTPQAPVDARHVLVLARDYRTALAWAQTQGWGMASRRWSWLHDPQQTRGRTGTTARVVRAGTPPVDGELWDAVLSARGLSVEDA